MDMETVIDTNRQNFMNATNLVLRLVLFFLLTFNGFYFGPERDLCMTIGIRRRWFFQIRAPASLQT